jgi:hypothetical protein
MGGYEKRDVDLGASFANGRFCGDRIRDRERLIEVRHVDGMRPWERAAWIAKRESAEREVS